MTFTCRYPSLEVFLFSDLTTLEDVQAFFAANDVKLKYIHFTKQIGIVQPENGDPIIFSQGMAIAITSEKIIMGLAPQILEVFFKPEVPNE